MKTEFSNSQYDLAYPDGIEHHWWNLARSEIVAKAIRRYAGPEPQVLEIGAGRGIAVKQLRSMGIPCYGVELANVSVIEGEEAFVTVGIRAEDLPLQTRMATDTLLLLDLIEHLPDPFEFICGLKKAFPHLSTLVITVPAGPKLWSNYDEFYGHQRRYTLKDMEKLAEDVGGLPLQTAYFFHSLYIPARLLALARVKRGVGILAPRGIFISIHKILAKIFKYESLLLPGKVRGASAIMCLKFTGTNH